MPVELETLAGAFREGGVQVLSICGWFHRTQRWLPFPPSP